MEDNGDMVVTLGKLQQIGSEEDKLEKTVASCREKTFGKVLDYLLDSGEDSRNTGYSVDQRRLMDQIYRWKEAAQSGQGSFDLMYSKPNGAYSEPLSLDSVVRDYPDMVFDKVKRSEFGDPVEYQGIDLVARFEPVNGR